MDRAEAKLRADQSRFSWENWQDNGAAIVGLIDHGLEDAHRPLLVCRDAREARVVTALLRGLNVKMLDGRPIDNADDIARALAEIPGGEA